MPHPTPAPLPIDSLLPDLLALMRCHSCVVLEAPPGAGKTTRVPPALLDVVRPSKQVWVAEPRRLAAKLVAHRVSQELGEQPGALVGYSVRFDDCSSPQTRLRYVTSGILLRRLLRDAELADIDCIVLDEFHERHSDTDLALALVRQIQARRPELRLLVMSATLDGSRIAKFLGNCPKLTSEGRLHPLDLEFEPPGDDRPVEKRVASALRRVLAQNPTASSLVFLPGAAEIRRTHAAVADMCQKAAVDVFVLHGDLGLDAQTKAITPGERPRVVLTTNIAESSITVEGITVVIDSGLSRQLDTSNNSGLPRLSVQKISRASATQRAGRAGRTAPGRVLRLYTKGDFDSRPEFDVPEIVRADFSEALLFLCAASNRRKRAYGRHAGDGSSMPGVRNVPIDIDGTLLDAPPAASREIARQLLKQLGAIDERDDITDVGERLLSIPLHPRLGRLLVECDSRGIGILGALAVSVISERDLREPQRKEPSGRVTGERLAYSADSDVVELIEAFHSVRQRRMSAAQMRAAGIDVSAFHAAVRTFDHLKRCLRDGFSEPRLTEEAQRELAFAVLIAFPDRVAKRRHAGSTELVLRSGAVARLSESSVVRDASWLVAIEAEERRESGRSTSVIRLASAIEEDWLLDTLTNELVSEEELRWSDPPGRVEAISRIRIGSLTLEESRRAAKPGPATAAVLLERVEQSGLLQSDELNGFFARLELLAKNGLIEGAELNLDQFKKGAVTQLLEYRIDLDGLDGERMKSEMLTLLPHEVADRLRTSTPEYVVLPGGRRCLVHYESGKSPFIASRLQDFFGLADTPTILDGRQRLVLHLLAPNQRPVQITEDLRGFWKTHYTDIRRQLMRRYPKHPWPEDGLAARPPDQRPRGSKGF